MNSPLKTWRSERHISHKLMPSRAHITCKWITRTKASQKLKELMFWRKKKFKRWSVNTKKSWKVSKVNILRNALSSKSNTWMSADNLESIKPVSFNTSRTSRLKSITILSQDTRKNSSPWRRDSNFNWATQQKSFKDKEMFTWSKLRRSGNHTKLNSPSWTTSTLRIVKVSRARLITTFNSTSRLLGRVKTSSMSNG